MKASDLLLRCLEAEGIEYIFGVPGEENADVMISLLDSKIEFVVCRHEQAAAFICDVYGRLTGKPAVCLGTLGPGATNLLTGVGDANMDRAPCIVLTGQASTTRCHKESHQVMDLVKTFEQCVKWGIQILHPDSIPEIVRKAVRLATTDKYGACHIDLPEDIAKLPTFAQPIPPRPVPRSAPNAGAVAEAAELIRGADFPVILTGNGTLRNNASDQLRAFARQNQIPVLNTFMGKGGFPPSDPLCLFTIGLGARDWTAACVENSDCVIAVGFDMVEYHPKSWNKGNEKTIVHVDQGQAEIDENYRTSAELIGDIGESLDALSAATKGMTGPSADKYAPYREQMLADFHEHDDDTGAPIAPQKVLHEVRKYLDDRDIVCSDVGAHKMWIARYLQTEEPNTIQISNGFCSMGFALPGAIGAKYAHPDRRSLAICGDGGVMMNIQDLETAVREKRNIVVMVWEDSQYGLIKWKQTSAYGKWSHIDFTNPDFVMLAEAFGMKGIRVPNAESLAGALEEAFTCGRPALIVLPIDYSQNMKLTAALKEIPASDVCEALADIDMFKGLSRMYRDAIAGAMESRTVAAGATLFSQGDPSRELWLIHEGEVKVEKDGAEVARVGAGGAVGEMAALSEAPRSASVTAVGEVTASVLDGGEFRALVAAQPQMGLALAQVLAERLAGGMA